MTLKDLSKRGPRGLRELIRALCGAVVLALVLRACVAEPFRVPSGSMQPTLATGDVIVVSKLAYGLRLPFTGHRFLGQRAPARGDVIVFSSPLEPEQEMARRVVGLPGDVIEIRDGTVWVNGVPQPRTPAGQQTYQEQNVSTGQWWSDTCRLFAEKLAQGSLSPPSGAGESAAEASWTAAAAQGLVSHGTLQCRRSPPPPREGPFQAVAPDHVFVLGDNRDRCADSRSDGGWQVPFGSIIGKATCIAWSRGRGATPAAWEGGLRFERLFKRIE